MYSQFTYYSHCSIFCTVPARSSFLTLFHWSYTRRSVMTDTFGYMSGVIYQSENHMCSCPYKILPAPRDYNIYSSCPLFVFIITLFRIYFTALYFHRFPFNFTFVFSLSLLIFLLFLFPPFSFFTPK